MKKVILIIFFILTISLPVAASGDTYKDTYDSLGADKLYDSLDSTVQDFLNDNGIDPKDSNWVNNINIGNVFSHILDLLRGGIKKPMLSGAFIIGTVLVTAAFTSFGTQKRGFEPALYAAALAVCAVAAGDIWGSVSAAVSAVKACSTFMLSFIPIFAAVVTLSGNTVTAASMSALLLGATELVSYVCSFAVLPLMGGYLAVSITTGVSPLIRNSGITEMIKRISIWILSLCSTVFVGVLGIQTAVNASADNLAMRTAKFILGTSVPVAGAALSEAVSTISASVLLLRSSLGIYGVVALAAIFAPTIAELLLWRLMLTVSSGVAALFELSKISGILKAVDTMLSLLVGIILLVAGMFIISLTVVTTAGVVR